MGKREISERDLLAAFAEDPNIRLVDLKKRFSCGSVTIRRELAKHGLCTKPLAKRAKPWLEGDRNPLSQWHAKNPDFGSSQRGRANPVHRVQHLYQDPIYIARITRGLREHTSLKTGRTYEEVYGAEQAASYKEKLRIASPQRLAKFTRRSTKPERIVEDLLSQIGASFSREIPIGFYTVDFLVGRLVIQADGDYWHANPAVYDDSDLNEGQRKRRRLDAACNSFLRGEGYEVLRLWERDLKRSPSLCLERIKEKIE